MARRKLRVPVNFLVLPVIFFGMFTIISAGVAASQGPNADWTVCRWMLAGLAACAVVYFAAPVDWISDKELTRMASEEDAEEHAREVKALLAAAGEGTLEGKYRFRRFRHYALLAVVIILTFQTYFFGDAKMADGGEGMAVLGLTLGTWRLFGRAWTGVELLFLGGCLAAIAHYLRKGFARWDRANRP